MTLLPTKRFRTLAAALVAPALLFSAGCTKEQSDLFPVAARVRITALPAGVATGNVPVRYDLVVDDARAVNVTVEYSVDGGRLWNRATEERVPGSDGTHALAANRSGVPHVFLWDSIRDLGLIAAVNVLLRVRPEGDPLGAAAGPLLLENRFADGQRVFVALDQWGQVAVIDALTLGIVDYLPVLPGCEGMAGYTSSGVEYLAVACRERDTVVIVNLSSHEVEQTVAVGRGVRDVDAAQGTAFGDFLLAANTAADTVTPIKIDAGNQLSVQATFATGARPVGGVSFVSGGVHYYATANQQGNSLTVRNLDAATSQTITVGVGPRTPHFRTGGPFGDLLFVPNTDDDTVSLLDPGAGFTASPDTPLRVDDTPVRVVTGTGFAGQADVTLAAFVAHDEGRRVSAYRFDATVPPAGREFLDRSPFAAGPHITDAALAASALGERLYLTHATVEGHRLTVYRTADDPPAPLGVVWLPGDATPTAVLVR